MSDCIRIIVTDDHMIVRTGLSQLIDSFAGMEVIAQAENGEEALFLCQKHQPDIIMMDIKMDGMGGLTAARTIRDHYPNISVIALSTFPHLQVVNEMMQAGAKAYLIKNISAADLEQAIRRVFAGETFISEQIDRSAQIEGMQSTDIADLKFGTQQKKVLALLTKGFTNPEIAEQLGVSITTARYHVSAILQKLDVSNRAEASAFAVRNHLIDADDF